MEISQMKRSEKRGDFACVMTQAVLAIFQGTPYKVGRAYSDLVY